MRTPHKKPRRLTPAGRKRTLSGWKLTKNRTGAAAFIFCRRIGIQWIYEAAVERVAGRLDVPDRDAKLHRQIFAQLFA